MAHKLLAAADAPAKIRAARAILDESQVVFAARLGVSPDWLARLESGAATPNLKVAVLIEELTGILPTEWITSSEAAIA